MYYFIKTVLWINRLMPKYVWKWRLQIFPWGAFSSGDIDMLWTIEGFFNLQKGQVFYTVDNEVSALKLLAFYENRLIGQEVSVRCPYERVSVLNGLNLEKV